MDLVLAVVDSLGKYGRRAIETNHTYRRAVLRNWKKQGWRTWRGAHRYIRLRPQIIRHLSLTHAVHRNRSTILISLSAYKVSFSQV